MIVANEIAILDSDGAGMITALFLYPITTPKQYTGGDGAQHTIIYTPSSGLSARGATVLSAAERASLDAGTLAFETFQFRYDSTITDAVNAVNLQAAYATHLARATARYVDSFRYTGLRLSAP